MDASTLAAVAIATETSQPAAVEEQEIPNIPEAPPIVIDYTEMPNMEMPAPYLPEEPYRPVEPPVVIDYTEMPVLVPDELEVPPGYAGAAQDGLIGNASAHVADDAS